MLIVQTKFMMFHPEQSNVPAENHATFSEERNILGDVFCSALVDKPFLSAIENLSSIEVG